MIKTILRFKHWLVGKTISHYNSAFYTGDLERILSYASFTLVLLVIGWLLGVIGGIYCIIKCLQ